MAPKTATRTVETMREHQVPGGTYGFGEMDTELREHVIEAETARVEMYAQETGMDVDDVDIEVEISEEGTTWWWREDECGADADCVCGPVTLLEACNSVESEERSGMIEEHAGKMRELFDHYWSGQGLIEGSSAEIGEACVDCLVEGAKHVYTVFENASRLAEELGEVLAAYHYHLIVGGTRYDRKQATMQSVEDETR